MFGSKKKVLETGTSAQATVINIEDTGMTINNNPRVKLALQVQPEGQPPFQATKVATVSRVAIPRVGAQYWVRFDPNDPSKLEFDTNKANQDLQAAQATYAAAQSEHDAMQLPPDLAASGIRGRGCPVTARTGRQDAAAAHAVPGVRRPEQPLAGRSGSREDTPVVPLSDAGALAPARRALSDGDPCQVTILEYARQYLRVPNGDEVYAVKVQVDGSSAEAMVPVPDRCTVLVQAGRQLPAKRIAYEPNALAIDWAAAGAGP